LRQRGTVKHRLVPSSGTNCTSQSFASIWRRHVATPTGVARLATTALARRDARAGVARRIGHACRITARCPTHSLAFTYTNHSGAATRDGDGHNTAIDHANEDSDADTDRHTNQLAYGHGRCRHAAAFTGHSNSYAGRARLSRSTAAADYHATVILSLMAQGHPLRSPAYDGDGT
jgi:hypothetical protein